MAGVSSPEMAAAVCEAGALGSIGVGAADAEGARAMIAAVHGPHGQAVQRQPVLPPARPLRCGQGGGVDRPVASDLHPVWRRAARRPSRDLHLVRRGRRHARHVAAGAAEGLVSVHFGLPTPRQIEALRGAGIVLLGSATSLKEAEALAAAGVQAVVAQGWEAGGHRGVFDPDASDDRLGVLPLTRTLVQTLRIPVIAAGGIMDGAGIAAALSLGAGAAQLGTAFVGCDESLADAGYRTALFSEAAHHTAMTRAVSGRPARCLANRFHGVWSGVRRGDRGAGLSDRLRSRQGVACPPPGPAANLATAPSGRAKARRWRGTAPRPTSSVL